MGPFLYKMSKRYCQCPWAKNFQYWMRVDLHTKNFSHAICWFGGLIHANTFPSNEVEPDTRCGNSFLALRRTYAIIGLERVRNSLTKRLLGLDFRLDFNTSNFVFRRQNFIIMSLLRVHWLEILCSKDGLQICPMWTIFTFWESFTNLQPMSGHLSILEARGIALPERTRM